MTTVVLPRTITRGAIEDVNHVTENFEALRAAVNGRIELDQFADASITSEALSGGMAVGVWVAQATFQLGIAQNGLGDFLATSGPDPVAVGATDAGERAAVYHPDRYVALPKRTAMLRGRVALVANAASSPGTVEIDLVRVTPVSGAALETRLTIGSPVLSCGVMTMPGGGAGAQATSPSVALSTLADGAYCCRIRRLTGFSGVGTNTAHGVFSLELAHP